MSSESQHNVTIHSNHGSNIEQFLLGDEAKSFKVNYLFRLLFYPSYMFRESFPEGAVFPQVLMVDLRVLGLVVQREGDGGPEVCQRGVRRARLQTTAVRRPPCSPLPPPCSPSTTSNISNYLWICYICFTLSFSWIKCMFCLCSAYLKYQLYLKPICWFRLYFTTMTNLIKIHLRHFKDSNIHTFKVLP